MMKTFRLLLLLACCAAGGAAQAQIKCWTENGKRVCGDAPPAGAKVTTVPGTTQSAEPTPAAKGAAKAPPTAADLEQDYRKRQADAQKAAEKTAAEEKDRAAKQDNCERARQQLRQLESGVRIRRFDAKGEPYVMEDAQREAETTRARQQVSQNCG